MTQTQKILTQKFSELNFKLDYPLARQSYFKIGGPAEIYLETDDKQAVQALIKFCREQEIKLTVLGGASNVIVADEGVSGLVLKLTNDEITISALNSQSSILASGAGTRMSSLVRSSVDAGLTGLEKFLGVPGSLSGAIYNNAHYLSDLIGEHVNRVEVIQSTGESVWLNQAECKFAYDSSRFQKTKEIIWQVEFKLATGNQDESAQLIKQAQEYRVKTQPLGLPSSGCIFQNVPNNKNLKKLFPQFSEKDFVSAGFLIDQAGLKGEKVGDLEVSQIHAAFIVNHGAGTAKQVKELINLIKTKVKEKFAVQLHEEVFLIS